MSFEDLESGRLLTSLNGSRKALQEPSHAVAAGVFQINTAVSSFQRLVNSLGTPKDTVDLRQKLQKSRRNIQQMVKDTSAKLKQASEIDQHSEVGVGKKIADAKLTKDFQSILREFQKAQRLAAEKETSYAPLTNKNTIELEITSIQSLDNAALLQSSRQEFARVNNEITFNEALIEEREEGIKEIHQQITEVNEIFKDLAVLVREQGAMIDDIGSNVENTHLSTTEATSQLIKASKLQKSVSSMSCLLMVIFGIILFIVVIVVVA